MTLQLIRDADGDELPYDEERADADDVDRTEEDTTLDDIIDAYASE